MPSKQHQTAAQDPWEERRETVKGMLNEIAKSIDEVSDAGYTEAIAVELERILEDFGTSSGVWRNP